MAGTQTYNREQIMFVLQRSCKKFARGQVYKAYLSVAREFRAHFGEKDWCDFTINQVKYITEKYGKDPDYGNLLVNIVQPAPSAEGSTAKHAPAKAKVGTESVTAKPLGEEASIKHASSEANTSTESTTIKPSGEEASMKHTPSKANTSTDADTDTANASPGLPAATSVPTQASSNDAVPITSTADVAANPGSGPQQSPPGLPEATSVQTQASSNDAVTTTSTADVAANPEPESQQRPPGFLDDIVALLDEQFARPPLPDWGEPPSTGPSFLETIEASGGFFELAYFAPGPSRRRTHRRTTQQQAVGDVADQSMGSGPGGASQQSMPKIASTATAGTTATVDATTTVDNANTPDAAITTIVAAAATAATAAASATTDATDTTAGPSDRPSVPLPSTLLSNKNNSNNNNLDGNTGINVNGKRTMGQQPSGQDAKRYRPAPPGGMGYGYGYGDRDGEGYGNGKGSGKGKGKEGGGEGGGGEQPLRRVQG